MLTKLSTGYLSLFYNCVTKRRYYADIFRKTVNKPVDNVDNFASFKLLICNYVKDIAVNIVFFKNNT